MFPLTGRVLLDGDRIDLDLRTHRQLGYLIADACGHILRKERGVNGVHRGEIGDVGEQDRRFHDIGVGITRLFEDVPQIGERLARLVFDAFGIAPVAPSIGSCPEM